MEGQIFDRAMATNSINENVLLPGKSAQVLPTPRKIPFKDTTNQALELLKQAKQAEKDIASLFQTPPKEEQSQEEVDFSNFELLSSEFAFPAELNCFCCGSNRKTDEEIRGHHLTPSIEMLEEVMTKALMLEEYQPEPMSPFMLQPAEMISFFCDDSDVDFEPVAAPREFIVDDLWNDSYCTTAAVLHKLEDLSISNGDLEALENDEDYLDVPEFDDSMEVPDIEDSSDNNGSIIQDW